MSFTSIILLAPSVRELAAKPSKGEKFATSPRESFGFRRGAAETRFAGLRCVSSEEGKGVTKHLTSMSLYIRSFCSLNQWLQKHRLIAPMIYGRNQQRGGSWLSALPTLPPPDEGAGGEAV